MDPFEAMLDYNPLGYKEVKWDHESKYPLLLNFDGNTNLGEVEIIKVGPHEIIGRISPAEHCETLIKQFYPAIGGMILEKEGNVITKFKLTAVSLSFAPNKDEHVKKIEEQLKDQNEKENIT
jgi:hypothetical protein